MKLINNVTVVSPDLYITEASILIDGDQIIKVYRPGKDIPYVTEVIDGTGLMAMPGFIDIHTHGALGADVMHGDSEAIAIHARAKVQEGVTSFLPTTLTAPQEDLKAAMKAVAKYARKPEYAKVPAVHIEGPYINEKCAGAQNPDFIRLPNSAEIKELNDLYDVAVVSLAVEKEGAMEFVKEATDLGIMCSAAHTEATFKELKMAKRNGLRHLTHFCNQMTPLHHREIGLVGAGLMDNELKLELICDKIHLCPDMIQLIFKVQKIENLMLITDSMEAAWLDDGRYDIGGLDVTVTNGEARLQSGSLAGSTLKFNEGLRNVYQLTNIPLEKLVMTTGWNQAQSLGLENVGKLEAGYKADIVLLDNDFEIVKTFVDGKIKYDLAAVSV
ncbi:N-acetylglucosamine-6-phosphate deacetylase [Limibacter armeniacum]|uniref:N-acetylglucosamine-6-phosphate deacetylase n=1 Tax=Limibacter armeniacum TaxID=466084 RepID=UPI002FE6592D